VWGIGGSDASILTENGMDNELFSSNLADLYLFPVLVTNNITNGVSRNFFAAVPEIPNTTEGDDSYSEDNPNMEKIISQHQLILRVRNITPASYRYFRTLSMQYSENRFNEQPVTVDSNIENGYGCFAVYNTANISLLEWETCETIVGKSFVQRFGVVEDGVFAAAMSMECKDRCLFTNFIPLK
jgi:hypothetical protein